MLTILRTDSGHPDFVRLVGLLDKELAERDGDLNAFYDQYNKIDQIKQAVVAYAIDVHSATEPEHRQMAVGCGAIKAFGNDCMEVKRMYVLPEYRGRGIATQMLAALEHWAAELNCNRCVLETGKGQPEAIALYRNRGYQPIPNYGQYKGIDNSLCFEKYLT